MNLPLLFCFIHGGNEIKNNLFLRNSQPLDLLEQYKNMLDFKNIKSLGCKVGGKTTTDKYNDIAAKVTKTGGVKNIWILLNIPNCAFCSSGYT